MIGTQTANRMPEREAVAARFEAAVVTSVRGDPRPAHERRVKQLCVAVAERMGLDSALQERVSIAAMLHDIGKASFPESVLLKPGPLSPEEWVLMRTHPQVAYEALTGMGAGQALALVAQPPVGEEQRACGHGEHGDAHGIDGAAGMFHIQLDPPIAGARKTKSRDVEPAHH